MRKSKKLNSNIKRKIPKVSKINKRSRRKKHSIDKKSSRKIKLNNKIMRSSCRRKIPKKSNSRNSVTNRNKHKIRKNSVKPRRRKTTEISKKYSKPKRKNTKSKCKNTKQTNKFKKLGGLEILESAVSQNASFDNFIKQDTNEDGNIFLLSENNDNDFVEINIPKPNVNFTLKFEPSNLDNLSTEKKTRLINDLAQSLDITLDKIVIRNIRNENMLVDFSIINIDDFTKINNIINNIQKRPKLSLGNYDVISVNNIASTNVGTFDIINKPAIKETNTDKQNTSEQVITETTPNKITESVPQIKIDKSESEPTELKASQITTNKVENQTQNPVKNTEPKKPNVESNSYLESLSKDELIQKVQAYARSMKAGGIEKCGDPDNPYFGESWETLVEKQQELIKELIDGKITDDQFGDRSLPIESILSTDQRYLEHKENEKIKFFEGYKNQIEQYFNILRGFISPKPITKETFIQSVENMEDNKNYSGQVKKLVNRIIKTKAFEWLRKNPKIIAKIAVPDVRNALSGTDNWSLGEICAVYYVLPNKFESDRNGEKANILAAFTANLENKLRAYKQGEPEWNDAYYKDPKKKQLGLLAQPFTNQETIFEDLTGGETPEFVKKKSLIRLAENREITGVSDSDKASAIGKTNKNKAYKLWTKAKKEFEEGINLLTEAISLIPPGESKTKEEDKIAYFERKIADINTEIINLGDLEINKDPVQDKGRPPQMKNTELLSQLNKQKESVPRQAMNAGLLSQLKKVKAPSGLADLIKKGPPKSSGIN